MPRQPSVPTVERLQRHDGVHEHERRGDCGHGIAQLPGNQVHHVEHLRQERLYPQHAQHAPHCHEHAVRASIDREERARVVPGHRAECGFHKPADEELERAANHGAHQKDHRHRFVMEAVERHGHEHCAHAVDGRERPEQHARAILVLAGNNDDEVIYHFNDQAQHATDHENPEHVEEVERDIAAPCRVQAERSLLRLVARLHVAELALQLALLGKRRIDVARHEEQEHDDDQCRHDMDIGTVKHDVAGERHRRKRHEDLGGKRGIASFIAEKAHTQQDEQHQHSRLGKDENHRHGKGRERLFGKAARLQKLHDDDNRENTAWDGDRPAHDAQHAEHLQQQGHLRLRLACGIDRTTFGRDHLFPFPMRHDAPFSNAAR